MRAVVMGGGQGSRLRPLTCNRPKPLVPICNKPVMEYTIELLRRHGIRTCLVTLHYLADEVMAYFGNGSDWEMRLLYSVEDEPLGTAGSVKRIEEYLNDTFVVVSGDALTDFDLTAAVAFHKERGAAATIVLTRVANPLEFGMVITDTEQRVVRFLEKPSWGEVFSDTINTGIYILEPSVLALMEARQAQDFSGDLFPLMLEKGLPIYGYVADGYWCDIGNVEQYCRAQIDLLQGKVQHNLPGHQLSEGVWVGPGAQIDPKAKLRPPLLIGRNCRVRENASLGQFTVLGDNCIVEDNCRLDRVVVWDNTYVGKGGQIFGGIVCRNVTLKGHVHVAEGVVIGDNVFVGRGANLHADVKVWPDKNVEAGANVSLSLVWGRKWPGSLFGEDGISGLGNIEITPEYALKLGAAYGALLPKGAVLISSRDAHPASRMINRALICGLVSVGVNVRDLQMLPSPVSRNAIKHAADAYGGVHVRVIGDDPRSILLEFFDSSGIVIDRSLERKIENKFFREDFRRTTMDEVGLIDFPVRTMDQYLEGFTKALRVDLIKQKGFKVVIDYGYGNASQALPSILGKLGCEVVSVNAYVDHERATEQPEAMASALQQLSSIVTTLKADLGVRLDATGERLTVVDESGRLLEGQRLLVLFCMLVLRQHRGALLAIPVTAPSVIEKMAQEFGGKVIWTRTDSRTLTYTATLGETRFSFAGNSNGAFVFPSFTSGFDAMFAFARLLEMMAREKIPLSQLAAQMPEFHQTQLSLHCDWQNKGRVMRLLLESLADRKVELVDGVKILEEGGWALVLPDRSQPELQVWIDAASEEQCRTLSEAYQQRVGDLCQQAVDQRLDDPEPTSRRPPPAAPSISEDRAFHFWTPGRYLGVRARNLREFVDTLHYIDPVSLRYHLERGDFANWVGHELRDSQLADRIRSLRSGGARGETLRSALLELFSRDKETASPAITP